MLYNPNIVIAGGGHGAARLVGGLVDAMPEARISAVITVGDSGSGTGEARRLWGTVAMGDLWKNVRAVSGNKAGELLEKRFGPEATPDDIRALNERFLELVATTGANTGQAAVSLENTALRSADLPHGLRGHTYGGLVLTGLTLDNGNDAVKGVQELSTWAAARAAIIPVTTEPHEVFMSDKGEVIRGEHTIDHHVVHDPHGARIWLQTVRGGRTPSITPEAAAAVAHSDIMLVGPGSLFTSLMPALAVKGMASAVARQGNRGGSLVAVGNLLAEPHATSGLNLADYVRRLQQVTRRPFDFALYHDTLDGLSEGHEPVRPDADQLLGLGIRAIGANLVAREVVKQDPNDPLAYQRSSNNGVAHHARAVATILQNHIL